jgi:hypothetical protein
MYKSVLGPVVCVLAVLMAGGCKSDSPATPAAGSSAPVAGTTALGGSTAVAGSAGGAAQECAKITVDSTLSQANCNNAADKCFLLEHAADIRVLGGQCATTTMFMIDTTMITGCIQYVARATEPVAKQCFTDCLDQALKAKFKASVSQPCLICPNAVAICTTTMDEAGKQVCTNQCLAAPNSQECTNCLCAQHPNGLAMGKPGSCLIGAYADCTGFRPTAEQVMCPAGSK